MPRDYGDYRHPQEALSRRQRSPRIFPGNRADVPQRCSQVWLLSAHRKDSSRLPPVRIGQPRKCFRVCFLLLVLRPNKWHKSECFERARLQPRRKPAFNERALAAEVDRSIRKTEPVSYSVKFRDTTLGMVGKN